MKCLLCNDRGKMDWLTGQHLCAGHRLYNDLPPMPEWETDVCEWADYHAHPAIKNSDSIRKTKRVGKLTHNPFKEGLQWVSRQ